jgi:signal peptidase
MVIIIYIILPEKKIKKKKDEQIFKYSMIAGLVYIIIYLLSGIVVSYGKNPYSNTLKGILINIWVTGIEIISREIIRFKIINSNFNKKNNDKLNIAVVIIFSLIELDISLKSDITVSYLFKQITLNIIPIVIKNILFTQIVQECSFKSAIFYEMIIQLTYWISPVLPNTPWIIDALLGIVIPLILFVYAKNEIIINKNHFERRGHNQVENNPKKILVTGIISIPLVCFVVGVLPISPKAIATASMYPEIKVGDVVIVMECSYNKLQIGDVIEYQIEDEYIIHRIVEIAEENGEYILTTKGDNNNSNDAEPVKQSQVVGKVIFKIKYLGLPSVKLNQIINSNKEIYVETGN